MKKLKFKRCNKLKHAKFVELLKLVTTLSLIGLFGFACAYPGQVDGQIGVKDYSIRDLNPALHIASDDEISVTLSQQDDEEIRLLSVQLGQYKTLKAGDRFSINYKDVKNETALLTEADKTRFVDIIIRYGKPVKERFGVAENILLIDDAHYAEIQKFTVTIDQVPDLHQQAFAAHFKVTLTDGDLIEGSFLIKDLDK